SRAIAVVARTLRHAGHRAYPASTGRHLTYHCIAGVRNVEITGRIQRDAFRQKEFCGSRGPSITRISLALRRACDRADISIDIDASNNLISTVGKIDVARSIDRQATGRTDGR